MVGTPESSSNTRATAAVALEPPMPLVRLGPGGDFEVAFVPNGRRLIALAAVPGPCWPRPAIPTPVPVPVRGSARRTAARRSRPVGVWSRLLSRLWSLFRSDADLLEPGEDHGVDPALARLVSEQREQLRSLESSIRRRLSEIDRAAVVPSAPENPSSCHELHPQAAPNSPSHSRLPLSRGYSPTMQEIADQLGVSKVTAFEHVESLISKGALVREANRARSLSLPEDFTIPGEEPERELGPAEFPLVGRIAAGYPVEKFEQRETLSLEEIFGPRRGQRGNLFALQVDGQSMRDEGIFDGDYVIVEQRNTAKNGERVVALLPTGETTLKTFFRERDGSIRLQPANPEFEPIIVDDCQIQGVVTGVLRRY